MTTNVTPNPKNDETKCPFCGAVICDHFAGNDEETGKPVFTVGNPRNAMYARVWGERIETGIGADILFFEDSPDEFLSVPPMPA